VAVRTELFYVAILHRQHSQFIYCTDSTASLCTAQTAQPVYVMHRQHSQFIYCTDSTASLYTAQTAQPVYVMHRQHSQFMCCTDITASLYTAQTAQPVYVMHRQHSQFMCCTDITVSLCAAQTAQPVYVLHRQHSQSANIKHILNFNQLTFYVLLQAAPDGHSEINSLFSDALAGFTVAVNWQCVVMECLNWELNCWE